MNTRIYLWTCGKPLHGLPTGPTGPTTTTMPFLLMLVISSCCTYELNPRDVFNGKLPLSKNLALDMEEKFNVNLEPEYVAQKTYIYKLPRQKHPTKTPH